MTFAHLSMRQFLLHDTGVLGLVRPPVGLEPPNHDVDYVP